MSIFSSFKRLVRPQAPKPVAPPLPPPEPEPEIDVPELSVAELQQQVADAASSIYVLDVREPYEWKQVRMDAEKVALTLEHIPMNSVPDRLGDLPADRQIVVMCAHGQRSYGVAHYLIENGLDAINLAGGITAWAHEGGAVEMGLAGE